MKKSLKGMKPSGDMVHKMAMKSVKRKAVKTTGKFDGKSNKLGQGGRAAQLKAQGVPGGVIGNLARAAHAAPGQKNFHKKKAASMPDMMAMKKKRKGGKKEPTLGDKDIEHKKKASIGMTGDKEMKRAKKRKGVTSMKGNVKRKGASMEGGVQTKGQGPLNYSGQKQTVQYAKAPASMPKVNISPSKGWMNAAGSPLKKRSKAKKK